MSCGENGSVVEDASAASLTERPGSSAGEQQGNSHRVPVDSHHRSSDNPSGCWRCLTLKIILKYVIRSFGITLNNLCCMVRSNSFYKK